MAWTEVEEAINSKQYHGVMVSVSGGSDSTALFHLIWRLSKQKKNIPLAVLHLDYGLRGAASAADQAFCRDLAERFGVPWFVRVVDQAEREQRQGEGIQAWARRLRRAEYQRYSADGWIMALGHHQGDLAENVLLRLARGAGPGHLLGMRPWRAPLWRPLLGFTKAELLAYLASHQLSYREDASNQSLVYRRNVLRHKVLAELEALFPGASSRIVACAEESRALAEAHCQARQHAEAKGVNLEDPASASAALARQDLAALLQHPPDQAPRPLSRRFLSQALAPSGAGRVSSVPGGGRLIYRDHQLLFDPAATPAKSARSMQHARSLSTWPRAALLSSDSYAFFRQGRGCWRLGASQAETASAPAWVEMQPAGLAQSLRFFGLNRSFRLKELIRKWEVPVAIRPSILLLQVRGELIALCIEGQLYRPNAQGQQTECSQAGLNLRYLTDGVVFFRSQN